MRPSFRPPSSSSSPLPTLLLLLAAGGGCDGSGEPEAPAYVPDLSGKVPALQQCLQQQCASAPDAAAHSACEAEECAFQEASWGIEPSRLRYGRAEGILAVDVAVQHTPAQYGGVVVPREAPAWLGVTVLTREGEDIDLAVQTVFPEQPGEVFTFSAEVGGEVRDILFGLWGQKIEPCEVDRSGCRMFGFVLDESLAAWPAGTYTDDPPPRQRIVEGSAALVIQGAGAPPEVLRAARDKAEIALSAELERFGASIAGPDFRLAPAPKDPMMTLAYRDEHDRPLARRVAERLGLEGAQHDPAAVADFVVEVGGTPGSYTCHKVQCADATGEDLLACIAPCP